MSTWQSLSQEDRALASDLAITLREEALRAPAPIRGVLLRDAMQSPHPSVRAWARDAWRADRRGTRLIM